MVVISSGPGRPVPLRAPARLALTMSKRCWLTSGAQDQVPASQE